MNAVEKRSTTERRKSCHLQQKGTDVENTRWVKYSRNGKTTACSLTPIEARGRGGIESKIVVTRGYAWCGRERRAGWVIVMSTR